MNNLLGFQGKRAVMTFAFFPAIFTSALFLYLTPFYSRVDHSLSSPVWVFLLLSLIAMTFSIKEKASLTPLSPRLLFWAAPSLLFLVFIPFPYNLCAAATLLGLGLSFFSRKSHFTGRVASGLFLMGLILLFQTAAIPFLIRVLARIHEIKLLNTIAFPFVTFFGLKASLSDGVIHIPSYEGLMAFPGTLEKSGFFFFILTLTGSAVMLLFSGSTLKRWLILVFSSLAYGMVRYGVMILVFAQVKQAEVFWKPMSVILSYLPLGLVLGFVLPLSPAPGNLINRMASLEFSKKSVIAALSFILSVVCLMGLFGFYDPGKKKGGQILIDEKHSDWEWSQKKFDTTWFGSQSTYNYYSMSAYLNAFYHVNHHTDNDLSPEILSRYDILILKTPTRAFSEREVDAISEFVEKGGGLFLIGDHTNVFGMSYYLNPVAKRFGLFFNYDSTYDLDSGTLTLYEKPKLFPHPLVMDVPYFLFATSCTLDAPFQGEDAMTGYGLRSRLLSYSGRAFFEDKPLQNYEFGLFLQTAAVKKGKGRVVAFSDSTCFSNFYMFIPGKPELVLGIMEWLNRENRFGWVPYMLSIFMIGFAGAGWFFSGKDRERALLLLMVSVLPGAVAGLLLFSQVTEKTFPSPIPHTPYKKIFFEREYSDFSLPLKALVDKDPKNYHTFYVWTQRMDFVPQLKEKMAACLEERDGFLIIINPVKSFSDQTLKDLVSFVQQGGKLLVLDGPQNKTAVTEALLAPFGMEIVRRELPKSDLVDRDGRPSGIAIKSGFVQGGEPALRTKENHAVFSVKTVGKGRIGVMADSYIFSNPVMGGTQITPSPLQRDIYNNAFYLLKVMENP